jgi:spore coat polysaccharide biosynthesis protein SpsF
MRVGFLITARLKSKRLPKKLILKIGGTEIIVLMIERLKKCSTLDEIIIATSTNKEDDPLCDIAGNNSIQCFRGSELNVVERILMASRTYGLDYIVNVTGDCPLVAVDFVNRLLAEYKKTNADLITTFDLPHGFYLYGIKPAALERILATTTDVDTAAWGKYFNESEGYTISRMKIPGEYQRKNYRLTLDYPEDFEFFTKVYTGMGEGAAYKTTKEIISFLDNHPEIVRINEHCEDLYRKMFEEEYNYNPDTLEHHG